MATSVLILGKSGSGKSTSLRNFEPDEIAFINVMGKPLPFKGGFESTDNPFKSKFSTTVSPLKKSTVVTPAQSYELVKQAIQKTTKKSVVIDDFGYMMTNHLMAGKEGGGSKFDLFDDIASRPWNLLEFIRTELPDDKIVYFMMHEDQNEFGGIKPKTIGKMTDDKICLEGLFTIVLRCVFDGDHHLFQTHMKGDDVTKTPLSMFSEDEIDNDLKVVDTAIREYYGLAPLKEEK